MVFQKFTIAQRVSSIVWLTAAASSASPNVSTRLTAILERDDAAMLPLVRWLNAVLGLRFAQSRWRMRQHRHREHRRRVHGLSHVQASDPARRESLGARPRRPEVALRPRPEFGLRLEPT